MEPVSPRARCPRRRGTHSERRRGHGLLSGEALEGDAAATPPEPRAAITCRVRRAPDDGRATRASAPGRGPRPWTTSGSTEPSSATTARVAEIGRAPLGPASRWQAGRLGAGRGSAARGAGRRSSARSSSGAASFWARGASTSTMRRGPGAWAGAVLENAAVVGRAPSRCSAPLSGRPTPGGPAPARLITTHMSAACL